MPELLTSSDLQAFMDKISIKGEIIQASAPTPTVELAAQAMGVTVDEIVKSILFFIDGSPVLAIASGTAPIDKKSIAAHFGVGKKRVKLGAPDQVAAIAGYEVGAMPPFGHRTPLPSLIDQKILDYQVVYAGGGAENAMLRLATADLLKGSRAQVLWLREISNGQQPGEGNGDRE